LDFFTKYSTSDSNTGPIFQYNTPGLVHFCVYHHNLCTNLMSYPKKNWFSYSYWKWTCRLQTYSVYYSLVDIKF